jgi:hypothetical protein
LRKKIEATVEMMSLREENRDLKEKNGKLVDENSMLKADMKTMYNVKCLEESLKI